MNPIEFYVFKTNFIFSKSFLWMSCFSWISNDFIEILRFVFWWISLILMSFYGFARLSWFVVDFIDFHDFIDRAPFRSDAISLALLLACLIPKRNHPTKIPNSNFMSFHKVLWISLISMIHSWLNACSWMFIILIGFSCFVEWIALIFINFEFIDLYDFIWISWILMHFHGFQ